MYQLTDFLPLTGINYFKLEQVNRDGKVAYSAIVAVTMNSNMRNALVMYPNPVTCHMQLNLNYTARNYSGTITAGDGRVVLKANGDIKNINQQINKNLFKIKPGVYVLAIKNATDAYPIKFIKQ